MEPLLQVDTRNYWLSNYTEDGLGADVIHSEAYH